MLILTKCWLQDIHFSLKQQEAQTEILIESKKIIITYVCLGAWWFYELSEF